MKTIKRTLAVVLLLGFCGFFLPYLVDLEAFSRAMETNLRQSAGVESHIGRVTWRWFPFPHVLILDIRLEHDAGVATLDTVHVYPDFGALVRGSLRIGSMRIIGPDVTVRSIDALRALGSGRPEQADRTKPSAFFQDMTLTVEQGRVTLPERVLLPDGGGGIPDVTVSDIRMTLASSPVELKIDGGFRSAYAGRCDVDLTLEDSPDKDIRWDLTARAGDVNLTPVREILLSLFKDHKTINTIFGDIIHSGHLRNGKFRFNGKHSQWNDLSRMTLLADVDQAFIHIPGTRLVLSQASGSLNIDNSRLSGTAIRAMLGQSACANGSFMLGLGQGDDAFGLDVDLDVNLSELPGVLDEFFPRPEWKRELALIENLQGRAQAHLTLGDRLKDIRPRISVLSMEASCVYRRLDEPLSITGGTLDISRDAMVWDHLSGTLGPSVIHGVSGKIAWDTDMAVSIGRLDARLDAGNLYRHLCAASESTARIQSMVTGVDGVVDIREFSLKGPLIRPKAMVYKGLASSSGLTLDSPKLPRATTLITPEIQFSNMRIQTRDVTALMGDQTLNVSGRLDGLAGDSITGTVAVRGTVAASSGNWLKSQGWIPELFFPRLPCDLAPLFVSWRENYLTLSGTVRHTDRTGRVILTTADMEVRDHRIEIPRLAFEDGGHRAECRITVPSAGDSETVLLDLDFKGNLGATTLAALFEQFNDPEGDLHGAFHLTWPRGDETPIRWTGKADIRNFKLTVDEKGTLSLGQAEIRGQGDRAEWDLSDLTFERSPSVERPVPHPMTASVLGGTLSMLPGGRSRVSIVSGTVCGVTVAGDVTFPGMDMELHLGADERLPMSFDNLLACLGESQARITGTVSIDAQVTGTPAMISQGAFTIRASQGVIDKARILSKVFSLLDLTELFSTNPVKHLMSEGYRYDSIDITGTITGHNIHVTQAKIIGAGINLYATGYIDLESQSLDLLVLASPFKTMDTLVNHIPIVGKVLGGKNKSLLSVPVKVEGYLHDPRTRILPRPISAVSSGILDAFVYTFKLPFELSYELVNGKAKTSEPTVKP